MKYQQNKELITSDLDDDLVMLDLAQGKYFALNPIAKRIWELLSEPKNINEIILVLLEEYEVSKEECLKDVEFHLSQLVKLKIVSNVA